VGRASEHASRQRLSQDERYTLLRYLQSRAAADGVTSFDGLRKLSAEALIRFWQDTGIGVADRQVDVFLLTARAPGRLQILYSRRNRRLPIDPAPEP
jgi:hypothetical protein